MEDTIMDNLKPEELLQNKFKEKVIETINYIKHFHDMKYLLIFIFITKKAS